VTDLYRLGIDTGGTFTDATLINEADGSIQIAKVPSTPSDPALAFIVAATRVMSENGVDAAQIRYVVHGTTVATNAVIEGNVAPTGFLTTDGFRDMLEIARQTRPSLYDLHFEKPRPLVPRHHCIGIPERLAADGSVVRSLDGESVRRAAMQLRGEGVESIAVCFLHSYLNPCHEREAGAILRDVFPEANVSLSSDVAPEFREYFRASTTIVNAAIQPVVRRYLQRIEDELRSAGVTAELLVMQSSGGVFTFSAARESPVYMVESGPAAGVMAASYLGDMLGFRRVISFDMGGTTAKAGLVEDGRPRVTKDYEVGVVAQAGGAKSKGYPIRTPVIDLVEIGAGGGSIAWVDTGGSLRVGPHSAGADPGPACYGKGGERPTITDANLVLGRLNADFFLGGEVALDAELAYRAIERDCAQPLGLDVYTAAHGIIEIANAAMTSAVRLVSVQRGFDPRDFLLVAFGGAGPVHANQLVDRVGIGSVLIPMSPGTTSALGLLVTDLQHDFARTLNACAGETDPASIDKEFLELEARGREALLKEGVDEEQIRLVRFADSRYSGQSFELSVPVPAGAFDSAALLRLNDDFHALHRSSYGFNAPHEQVELVSLRVTAIGSIGKPEFRRLDISTDSPHSKAYRPVWFVETSGFVECPIYDRYGLGREARLTGPAIVEEMDSTTVIHPGFEAVVDQFGNLLITRVRKDGQR
jgi:N-methylhydantoinase A